MKRPLNLKLGLAALALSACTTTPSIAQEPAYFDAYDSLSMERDGAGVLIVTMHSDDGPITFTAEDHEQFVDAFYRIGRDRDNQIVILTGAGGDWMADIDFNSFGNVADPDVWSKVHDEGVQIMENLANIRVPMICAVEGRAWVHSEYCLMANIIIAGEGATFHDAPHYAGGIVPGDGIFTTWSYWAGPGAAQAFLLAPEPMSARDVEALGVVAEVVPDGEALATARDYASRLLGVPEVTRRNTRIHFIQPLKLRLVQETGYGLSLEGASAAALVKQFSAQAGE